MDSDTVLKKGEATYKRSIFDHPTGILALSPSTLSFAIAKGDGRDLVETLLRIPVADILSVRAKRGFLAPANRLEVRFRGGGKDRTALFESVSPVQLTNGVGNGTHANSMVGWAEAIRQVTTEIASDQPLIARKAVSEGKGAHRFHLSPRRVRLLRLVRALLSHVPGTKPFRRRQIRQIHRRVELYLRVFTRWIKTIDPQVKSEVERTIRQCEWRVAETRVWDRDFMLYLVMPCAVVLVLCGALFGIVDAPWLLLNVARPSSWPWDSLGSVIIAWIITAGIIPFLPNTVYHYVQDVGIGKVLVLWLVPVFLVVQALTYSGSLPSAVLRLVFGQTAPSQLPLYVWPGIAAALALILSPAVVGDEEVRRRFAQAWFGVAMLAYAAMVLTIVTSSRASAVEGIWSVVILASLMGTLVPVVVLAPVWMLFLVIARTLDRRRLLRHPDALLVDTLVRLLYKLESQPERWTDLSFKREVMSDLEDAAVSVERGLWLKLRSGDAFTDIWLRRTTDRVAAGIRARKMWVLTPKPDTYKQLLAFLADSLVSIVRGNWDSLDKRHPMRVPRLGLFRQRLANLSRIIIVALLPLAGLLGLQQTAWALKGDNAAQGVAIAVVWAALSLIAPVDPLSDTKLNMLKGFKGFPFGTSRGGE